MLVNQRLIAGTALRFELGPVLREELIGDGGERRGFAALRALGFSGITTSGSLGEDSQRFPARGLNGPGASQLADNDPPLSA